MRRPLDALRRLAAGLRGLSPRRRNALVAGVSALLVLTVATTLLVTVTRPSDPAQRIAIVPTSTNTATATNSPTPTSTPRPTATHASAPPPPVVVPPPPPVPTPPPNPTSNFCPTPTPFPTATATATATGIPTATATAASTATGSPAAMARLAPQCQTCPYYTGNNPSQSQIRAALIAAAGTYHLPQNMLFADAWQESKWHEDVTSCDGGVGLMQIQYYLVDYFNGLQFGACTIGKTTYDPSTLQGNADLGAKVFAYLECYYTFGVPYGGTTSQPANGSSAYNYVNASPPLNYPDTTTAGGAPNPNSFCAAVYNDASRPEYQALPMTSSQPWSCPYTPTPTDATLLDIVLSAYNAGQGAIYNCSCIPNPGYVSAVESYIPQFSSGALP